MLWLLIALVAITLVGHGLWVLGGAVLRAIRSAIGSEPAQPIAAVMCPRCGEAWKRTLGHWYCPACGWPRQATVNDRLRTRTLIDLLLRRLDQCRAAGLVTIEERHRLARDLMTRWHRRYVAPAEQGAIPSRPSTEAATSPGQADLSQPGKPLPTWMVDEASASSEALKEPPTAPDRPSQAPEGLAARPDFAERIQADRAAWETEPSDVSASEEPSRKRRPSLGRLLTAFLEERNIRWGELVGGLLIVGCSLALVVGYWDRIAERPLLRFVLANGAVMAFFAIGHYAERHWRLPTTAHGLLMIATLLVPLSVLAIVSSDERASAGLWLLGGELVVLGVFTALIGRARRSMGSSIPWTTALGVVIPSAGILAAGRWVSPNVSGITLSALGAVPVLAHAGAIARAVLVSRRRDVLDEPAADDLLSAFGLTVFAAAVMVGVALDLTREMIHALQRFALLAPLAGAPALAVGLTVWRKAALPLFGHRVAGSSIAVAGMLVMLAGVALAWPDPSGIVTVAVLDSVVLAVVAVAFELPAALTLAGGLLALAALVSSLVVTGPLTWDGVHSAELATALTSASAGATLVLIALPFEAGAAWGLLVRRRPEAKALGLVSVLAGLAGLGLVSWHGFGVPRDPTGATWSYVLLASAALFGAVVTARRPLFETRRSPGEVPVLAWSGSALLLAALFQGFAFRSADAWGLTLPWSSALLGHATVATGLAAVAFVRRFEAWADPGQIRRALIRSACATSILAALRLAWQVSMAELDDLALHLVWLSGVWFALAWLVAARGLFMAFQAALTASVIFAVASWLDGGSWFEAEPNRWLDPHTVQAEGIALALLGLVWIGLRTGARTLAKARPNSRRLQTARWLIEPPWPSLDRLTTWGAVLALVSLAVYGVVPGVAQELSPQSFAQRFELQWVADRPVPPASSFEVAGIPHDSALGRGSWLLFGVALAVMLAGQWERCRRLDLLGALLVSAMAVPLTAGRWEPDVAVASALRWGVAIGLPLLAAPIWARDRLARVAEQIGWRLDRDRLGGVASMAIALLIALTALPLLAMAAYVARTALSVHHIDAAQARLWQAAALLFVILATIGIGTIAVVRTESIEAASGRSRAMKGAAGLLIALGALALVTVTVLVVGSALAGDPIVGPSSGTFFDRIGLAGSYAPPLVLVALALSGFAAFERSPGFALAGGLLLSFGATIGWLLSRTAPFQPLDAMLWIRVAQLNAIVGSLYAFFWMVAVNAWRRKRALVGATPASAALAVQAGLPTSLVGLLLIVGVLGLLADPRPSSARGAIADLWGASAFVTTLGAVVVRAKRSGLPVSLERSAAWFPAAATFLALATASSDTGKWFSYHAMMVAHAAATGMLLLIGWQRRGLRPGKPMERGAPGVTTWAAISMAVVVLFALRAYGSDPHDPRWWTVGGLTVSAILASGLAAWSCLRLFVYAAGALLNLGASLWWLDATGGWFRVISVNLVVLNTMALALPVPAWLWLELRRIRPALGDRRSGAAPFHRVAAWGALAILALMVVVWLLGDVVGDWPGPEIGIGCLATLASLAIAMASGFWDDRSRSEVAGLYGLGLCAVRWILAGFDLPRSMLSWIGSVVLVCHIVVASLLWSDRRRLRGFADRLKVPRSDRADDPEAGLGWLVPANIGLSAVVAALAFGVVLTDADVLPRFSAAKAALATTLAIGLLARGERRSGLRLVALGFGAVGALAWGWAWIAPDSPTATLDRTVAASVTLIATAVGYGLGLVTLAPRATRWARAARRLVPALLGLSGAALLGVIAGELAATATGDAVAISRPALVIEAATLLGAAIAALVAAIVPGRDPLRLPDRGRTIYVYSAEALLALLVLHLRLTMPWLFGGIFARYWPLFVIGLAFTGVGLGELFRRQGRLVLAEPLERSGAVLPTLPLLGAFWLQPRPGEDTLFLVLAGALYTTLSLLRSSAGFGALAALALNAGLWTWLGRQEGFGLLEHPQFWVVPPTLCLLAGVHLNHDRLGGPQSAALRHVAAGIVYLSSTADLIINGVAEDPWLPLVLGGLSLAGIFAGIALRVRGFLLLGVVFLGLSIFAMIWHAAVDLRQTWLWAASGIVVGILILVVFAVFEKRRRAILEVVERISQWKP